VNDLFTCTVGDEGHANDACEGDFACAPGLLCREAAFVGIGCNTDFCCTSFCEFPDGACPNPDQKCLQYYDAMNLPDPGLANIGTCGVSS
jgi:hypothetical protein